MGNSCWGKCKVCACWIEDLVFSGRGRIGGGDGVAVGSSRVGGGGDWNRDEAPTTSFPPPKSRARTKETSIKRTSGDNDSALFQSATKMLQSLFINNQVLSPLSTLHSPSLLTSLLEEHQSRYKGTYHYQTDHNPQDGGRDSRWWSSRDSRLNSRRWANSWCCGPTIRKIRVTG